ncbi:MAG: PAS domain S-box protein, partial [Solirubrobacterales bacterium]|nr:PAS domain S-box protein [Solirubrobacterales bacterium]
MHRVEDWKDLAGAWPAAAPSPPPSAEHEALLTGAALDAIDVGVVVIDDERRLLRCNAASAAILGVDLSSAIGTMEWWRPLRARRSGASASVERDAAATVLRTGKGIRDVEVAIDRPDGAVVSLAVDYLPLRTRPAPVTGVVIAFRDVAALTAPELSRRELIAARDFFQATLDSFPAQVAVLDESGEVLTTNRAWKEFALANGGDGSPTTTNYFAVCDAAGDDEFALRAAVGLRAVAAGEREEFTLEYPCSSAEEERWFLLRGSRYEGPGSARMVVAHDDVTERHVAARQVLEQATLLDEVDVAVIATSTGRDVTQWNRKAEELYGWSRREALGRHVDELIAPRHEDSRALEQALATDGHWAGLLTARAKDGTPFPSELRVRTMVDASGEPFGAVGVSSDVTSRVASERALIEARDYMRAVADSMGQGLLTLDVDGRVSYVNPAAGALLGWAHDQLRGRSMTDITVAAPRDDGSAGRDDPLERARLDGAEVRVEDAAFLRSDGTELPVAYTTAPFETATGVQGRVVLFEDISERKAYEAALLQDVEKLSWIDRIQQALADDRFVLHAQPIIDLRTGNVVQRELLLRMREP